MVHPNWTCPKFLSYLAELIEAEASHKNRRK